MYFRKKKFSVPIQIEGGIRKSKFKWEKQRVIPTTLLKNNAKSVLVPATEPYSKVTQGQLQLSNSQRTHSTKMPTLSYTSMWKSILTSTTCNVDCVYSGDLNLRTCCFINPKLVPPNTIQLKQPELNLNVNKPPQPMIAISKHKLVRKVNRNEKSNNTSVVFNNRMKLIRTSKATKSKFKVINNPHINNARSTFKPVTPIEKTKVNISPLKSSPKKDSKLVVVNRNKLIRSSLLKEKPAQMKSILHHIIQQRRHPVSASSFALLSRNKLIRNKSKLKWSRTNDLNTKPCKKNLNTQRTFVSVGENKLIRKSLFSKCNIKQELVSRKPLLAPALRSSSKRVQRFTNHLSRINMKYMAEGKIRYLNKCKNNKRKLNRRKMSKICHVFRKSGSCLNKDKNNCPMIHDTKYVALCHKYLKGDCNDIPCLLSHDTIPQKVPNCIHFLQGNCNAGEKCIFLHAKPDPGAAICLQYLRGYCENAEKCTNWHIRACPNFKNLASCEKGDRCHLPHRGAAFFTASKPSNDMEEEHETSSGSWRYFAQKANKQNEEDSDSDETVVLNFHDEISGAFPDFIPL